MGAFAVSVGLFLFWALVGWAVLALLHTRRNSLQNLLLAPAAGVALTVILIFLLNRIGLPVAYFARYLGAVLVVAAVGVLLVYRPSLPWRTYHRFAGVLLLALFLAGRPMLEFGFDWVSYCNDDMANYCLAAQRFLQHGFFELPREQDLLEGRDYSQYYYFYKVLNTERPGSELILAWTAGVTGLDTLQVFMPVILAYHVCLISAAGALLCLHRSFRRIALATCALLAISPLNTLGAIYQLIAQVSGLALLAGAATLLLRPFGGMTRRTAISHGVLVGLFGAALLIVYPEVVPFLVLGVGLHLVVGLRRQGLPWRPLLVVGGIGGVICIACVGGYLVEAAMHLLRQQAGGMKGDDTSVSLFPYFLVPSGLSTLWGLLPLAISIPEPWLSWTIWVGAQLLLAAGAAAAWLTYRRHAAATLTLVMLLLAGWLFRGQAGFGLFKLAMFIQPFLLATLVTAWFRLSGRRAGAVVPLVLLAVACLPSQWFYVETSRGISGIFVEIPEASRAGIAAQIRESIRSSSARQLVLATNNMVLAKLQGLYAQGIPANYPCVNYFQTLMGLPEGSDTIPGTGGAFDRLVRRVAPDLCGKRRFDLHDDAHPGAVNTFVRNDLGLVEGESSRFLIADGPRLTVLNRWHNLSRDGILVTRRWAEAPNQLVFIDSDRGRHYYGLSKGAQPSLYRLENDVLVPGQTMSGTGRHHLYQVVNPSPTVRFVLEVTTTVKADGENRLPHAAVIGETRRYFDVTGRGSARVFSPPVKPQVIDGQPYLALDMGEEGKAMPNLHTGLMALYGKHIRTDRRLLIGFTRDISLISEEEYAHLTPPSKLETFPDDLLNRQLEYSGICEDGWLSADAYFCLLQRPEHRHVVVRGLVPGIAANPNFSTELRVLIDSREVMRQRLVAGEFHLCAPLPPGSGRRRLELRFSHDQRLPDPDNRPMAALVSRLGFVSEFEEATEDEEGDSTTAPVPGEGDAGSRAGEEQERR